LKAGRVPRLGTIQRVLRTIDVEELEQALSVWVQPLLTPEERDRWEGIAIDGKTLRGSGSLQLLSAFSHRLEAVLGQRAVAHKTNEIPEARTLLRTLTLEGKLVTADALHTQRDTAQVILETSLNCQVAKTEIAEEKSLKRKKSYRRADTNLKASVAKGIKNMLMWRRCSVAIEQPLGKYWPESVHCQAGLKYDPGANDWRYGAPHHRLHPAGAPSK
jgi:predicted transposase YbfD/YdcC